MIRRIVKMTFNPEKVEDFLAVFRESRDKIASQPGCTHLELFQVTDRPNIFMTYSYWEDESDLENYRHSDLFKSVWARTKIHFADRPEAWSVKVLD
ncbi:antibiotic biosynthesis monooxygenase [bacterium SCSIO 12741]|nr:antibiotic biosynthesis monooxygenase [bacterium SCSIO 12741]